jgi:tRNA threonylcarbamoyladenosine biosynthesis protein TsaB
MGQTPQFASAVVSMIILGIDTATDAVSVALHDGDVVLASSEIRSDRQHAEALTPMIDFVCKQASVELWDVGGIAVDIGPGLFTGMRVGIASAQAIAQVIDVPIIPVTSLDILAAAVQTNNEVIASVVDARRGEVYWSLYRMTDGKLKQVGKPQIGSPEMCAVDVLDRGQSTLLVGTGALKHETEFCERLNPVLPALEIADDKYSMPLASTLVEIAHERALRGEWVQVDEVVPMYLRAPDAEINWATRSAQ